MDALANPRVYNLMYPIGTRTQEYANARESRSEPANSLETLSTGYAAMRHSPL